MPTLTKENYPHNAKITAFYCNWCNTKSYAKYKTAKYCSGLCRHNAYLKRKEIEINEKRDYHRKVTEKSRDFNGIQNSKAKKRKSEKIVGCRNVQQYFSEMNINITLKSLKEMKIYESMQIGENTITRHSVMSWLVER